MPVSCAGLLDQKVSLMLQTCAAVFKPALLADMGLGMAGAVGLMVELSLASSHLILLLDARGHQVNLAS